MNRILVGLGVILFSVPVARAEGPPMSGAAETMKPFVREWRVVLEGKDAERMSWTMPDSRLDRRSLSSPELDAIEQQLLPALAADLKDAGSSDQPERLLSPIRHWTMEEISRRADPRISSSVH